MGDACHVSNVASIFAVAARGLGNSNDSIGLTYLCCNIFSGFDFFSPIRVFIYLYFCFIACISYKPPQIFS